MLVCLVITYTMQFILKMQAFFIAFNRNSGYYSTYYVIR